MRTACMLRVEHRNKRRDPLVLPRLALCVGLVRGDLRLRWLVKRALRGALSGR